MINTVALINISLAITFGSLLGYLLDSRRVLLGAYLEIILFVIVLWINSKGKYTVAAVVTHLIMNAAVLYFGLVLGAFLDVNLMAIFLVGLPMLILRNKAGRLLCIAISICTMVALEINKTYAFITPRPYDSYTAQWIAKSIILLLNAGILYFYDATNLRLQQNLNTLMHKLARANEAKTVYVRETIHEVRQPLNTITLISQYLLQFRSATDEVKEVYRNLDAACYQALHIINATLDLSRLEAGKVYELHAQPIIIKEWIEKILSVGTYSAQKNGIQIRLHISEDFPTCIEGDQEKLTRIANNLIYNAIKYTAPKSKIDISLRAGAGNWQLSVADEGTGMTAEQIEKIFLPFETQGGNASEGTGLGLYMVERLVTLLGGTIQVNSNTGNGVIFTATFKLVETTAPVKDKMETPDWIEFCHKILVIEDEYMQRYSMMRLLKQAGVAVEGAESGESAMKVLESGYVPDLLLVDHSLEDTTGLELIRRIKQMPALKQVPAIIVSGDAYLTREMVCEQGADGLILKPLEMNEFNRMVTLLHQVRTTN
ncbi:hybrid sensor histidine kinase/response regulator [Chitinophaga sp. HK235]|uniref:ATP-binding response regulator n=1 Tax=Chitinophaga sp. HK235 TaxID=2952571 RepID=UPI001BAC7ECF|nr:hybrid sensor histidine kinase/response regulator [Chitinophaga sp. HK235]